MRPNGWIWVKIERLFKDKLEEELKSDEDSNTILKGGSGGEAPPKLKRIPDFVKGVTYKFFVKLIFKTCFYLITELMDHHELFLSQKEISTNFLELIE